MRKALPRLPSLDLLRSFVAVGRRLSITRAAAELCLTQSAVSRQILNLEEQLGVRLLIRGHRSLEFTEAGRHLFRHADIWLEEMAEVLGAIQEEAAAAPVTITASIGVTALWLLPLLGRFQQAHPEINVRIATNNRILDLDRENIDLAIRYCENDEAPPGAVRLFGETVMPVAHSALGLQDLPLEEALTRQAWLDLDVSQRPWLQWSGWLAQTGLEQVKPRNVLCFNHYDQLIQAAVAGQGIALGRRPLLDEHLQDGRLVALGNRPVALPQFAHWLVCRDVSPGTPAEALAKWIRMEAAAVAETPA